MFTTLKPLKSAISKSRRNLKNPYAYLNDKGVYEVDSGKNIAHASNNKNISVYRRELKNPYAFLNEHGKFEIQSNTNSLKSSKYLSKEEQIVLIDSKVKEIHRLIWKQRENLCSGNVPYNPIELLTPEIALKAIGYKFKLLGSLGQYSIEGNTLEVAGIIDRENNQVSVSQQFPINVQRFTAAHELGHAILHSQTTLHRDRPLDGSTQANIIKDKIEFEADIFASHFLIPENLLKRKFRETFLSDTFILNNETMFALGIKENKKYSLRDISRILAKAEYFNGSHIVSLSKQFFVSIEAMAIRLEELCLVQNQ